MLGIHKVFLCFLPHLSPNLSEENCNAPKIKSVSRRFGGLSVKLGFLPGKHENVKDCEKDSFWADLSNAYAAKPGEWACPHAPGVVFLLIVRFDK